MLTSPSGKSYIGQTKRPIEERFKEHQKSSSGCVAIYRAIQYHGWDNFEKHWYEVPDDDLNDHEELMVEVLGTLAPGGYNLIEGGGSGGQPSEEIRKKMSEAQKGEKSHMFGKSLTDDIRQKISKAKKGKYPSDEHKQKLSDAKKGENHPMFGKQHKDDTKQKMSATHTGKIMTDEARQRMSDAHKGKKSNNTKEVYQYDMDGTFIQSFASRGEAARSLHKNDGSAISQCARGKNKSSYGFKWSYTKL